MPQEIEKVTNPKELQSFLESERDYTRMAAVRRLSEIEGPNSINSLVSIYKKKRPMLAGYIEGRSPVVKLEVIRSLGKIGTEQAKNALVDMLKDIWEKGPVLPEKDKDKRNFYYDCDFRDCTPLLLATLYQWSGDKDISELAKKIASSEDVEKYYRGPNSIGQRAWEICIKAEMNNQGIVEDEESAIYLMDKAENIRKEGIDIGSNAIKAAAIRYILNKFSDSVLTSLLSKYREEYKNEPRGPKEAPVTKKMEELRDKISLLKAMVKERDEQQEKMNSSD